MKNKIINCYLLVLFFILFLFQSSILAAAMAPYAKLYGVITDTLTGNPINQAEIIVASYWESVTTISSINGYYEITLYDLDPDAPYTMTIQANDYKTKTIDNIILSLWETRQLNVSLSSIGDIIPPAISDINASVNMSDFKNPKATIKWTTDENATSSVIYWKGNDQPNKIFINELVLNHNLEITNLIPGKTYNYYVKSADTYSNTSTSQTLIFETKKKYNVTVLLSEPSDILHDVSHDYNYYKVLADAIKDYHLENSYNIIDLNFQIDDNNSQWYKLDKKELYYGELSYNFDRETEFVEEARTLAAINKPSPLNNEILIVVHAGLTAQKMSNKESAKGKMETSAGGPDSPEILVGEYDDIGDWAHEIGHTIGINFDLYNRGNVGVWDLMASGNTSGNYKNPSYMSSFTREKLGLLKYQNVQIENPGDYWINSLTTSQFNDAIFTYFINNDTYYIIEARNKSGQYNNRWDISIPKTALVLYYVKNNGDIVNIPNNGIFSLFDYPFKSCYDYYNWLKFTPIEVYDNPPDDFEVKVNIQSIPVSDIVEKVRGVAINASASFLNKIKNYINFTSPEYPIILPDLDLHLYTEDGKHIGMNYKTGEYENEIYGAIVSGNSYNGYEWIFVPENTKDIHFVVNSFPNKMFINDNQTAFETSNINTEDSYNLYGVYIDPSLGVFKSESINQQIPAGVQFEHTVTINNYQVIIGNGNITIGSIEADVYHYYSLGFIDNEGIKESLLEKLKNANKKLETNKKQTIINIINSFIAEVNAQSEKHISREVSNILINNVKKVINQL